LILLSERRTAGILPFFPLSYGVRRVDDRGVISGIIYVIKHGLYFATPPFRAQTMRRFARRWGSAVLTI
jgi:hypothetical protein